MGRCIYILWTECGVFSLKLGGTYRERERERERWYLKAKLRYETERKTLKNVDFSKYQLSAQFF